MQSLQQIAFKPVLVLGRHTPLQEAARALSEKQVGCLLVSDERGHIAGIVTDRDLGTTALANGLTPNDPISKVMSSSLIYVSENAQLSEAVNLMKEFGVRRLPVLRTSKAGLQKCVGILTLDDLILSKAISQQDLFEVIANQIVPLVTFEIRRSRHNPISSAGVFEISY